MYNFQKRNTRRKYIKEEVKEKSFLFAPPTCAHDARDARVTRVYVYVCVYVYVHNVYDWM